MVGFHLDLTGTGRIAFALNGARLAWAPLPAGPAFQAAGRRLYPAGSLMSFQHVRFNFGTEPYRWAGREGGGFRASCPLN